jgi:uncharacterized membrane protein YhaH (DUF805 family)
MIDENPYASPESESIPAEHESPALDRNAIWLMFSFRGRAARSSLWGATIVLTAIHFAVIIVSVVLTVDLAPQGLGGVRGTEFIFASLMLIWGPILIWASLAVHVKRWHDRDKSGWWTLINLIPYIGPVWSFIELGCLRGTPGPNRFGDDPTDIARSQSLRQLGGSERIHAAIVEWDGTGATNDDLIKLAGNRELLELRLGGAKIDDTGLKHVRGLTGLKLLDLSMTAITDAGIDCLLGLEHLTTLWIGGTRLSDAGLLRLAVLLRLRFVSALNTQVTREGAQRLEALVPGCRVVVS